MIGYPSIVPINFMWFTFVVNVGKNVVRSGHTRLMSVMRYINPSAEMKGFVMCHAVEVGFVRCVLPSPNLTQRMKIRTE